MLDQSVLLLVNPKKQPHQENPRVQALLSQVLLSLFVGLYQPTSQSLTYPRINRRRILQPIGWGGAGLGAFGLHQPIANQPIATIKSTGSEANHSKSTETP